jgi:CheY-like chemotaxis protein
MDASRDLGRLASRHGPGAPARVLLVEDDERSRVEVLAMLARYDLDVVVAVDGGAALDRIDLDARDAGLFDLVLLDLGMPVTDGIATARMLRLAEGVEPVARRSLRMPIVAMAADDHPATLAACEHAGFDDVLVKPLEREELDAACERWLGFLPADQAGVASSVDLAGPPGDRESEAQHPGSPAESPAAVLWCEVDRLEELLAGALEDLRREGRAAEMGEAASALAVVAGRLGASEIEALARGVALAAGNAPGDLDALRVQSACLLLALERLRPARAKPADTRAA